MTPEQDNKLTDEESKLFAEFTRQTKRHLKGLSKNQLVATCIALLIENYNMKVVLHGPQTQEKQSE